MLAYDLAIALNDWCALPDGDIDGERARAMLAGYQSVRPLSDAEKTAWPVLLRAAGLRFWTSRLYDKYLPQTGELTFTKTRRSSSGWLPCTVSARISGCKRGSPSWRCCPTLPYYPHCLRSRVWPGLRHGFGSRLLACSRRHSGGVFNGVLRALMGQNSPLIMGLFACAPCWGGSYHVKMN